MSRIIGGGFERPPRTQPGLEVGILDFELDIGVVNDVDVDPLLVSLERQEDPSDPHSFQLKQEEWLSIQGTEFGQNLFVGRRRVALPEGWKNPDFPFVRGMFDGKVLVTDTTFDLAGGSNTWIIDRDGGVSARFGVGSAAVEIAPLGGGMIAVAYHPMSAVRFGHRVEPQQRTAIAFFDKAGQLLTTFNHEAARSGVSAENVRCMTRLSAHELLFVPETARMKGQDIENPVIFYNCTNARTIMFSAPFGGAEACSAARGPDGNLWVLLASPEGFEDQVIAFDPVRKISQYLGAFTGIFRGLASHGLGGSNLGGFLAQEMAAEYEWVLPDQDRLPHRGPHADKSNDDRSDDTRNANEGDRETDLDTEKLDEFLKLET